MPTKHELIVRLEKSQCDCNKLGGKTIEKSVRERGFYWFLFTDGTWCHTDYQLDVYELIETWHQDDVWEHTPFVELGLATEKDFIDFWERDKVRSQDEIELQERAEY